MAIMNLASIDSKLAQMYENQITTNFSNETIDKSEILFEQMNFIALNNKSWLNSK